MEVSNAIEFFNNPKWQSYNGFVKDYSKFVKNYYEKYPEKSVEKAVDFFVELMTQVSFEQERAKYMEDRDV